MKISVLTICYNAEAYIERAIQSVMQQRHTDWEHIIVDGGSTDGTVDVLKKYNHLKWISEPDQGQSDAMNKAFTLSGGAIIGYLNADDYYLEDVFSEVAQLFLSPASPDIVTGRLQIHLFDKVVYRDAVDDYKYITHFWLHKFPANPVCYFYKRELQLKTGCFPVDNHQTMDYWFLLRGFNHRKIFKIDKEFGVFDLHADTKTFASLSDNSLNDKLLREYLDYARTLPLYKKLKFLYPWYRLICSKKLNEQLIYLKFKVKIFIKNRILNVR
jgi:glycosyltransferase involved in cell wall biosynthesis